MKLNFDNIIFDIKPSPVKSIFNQGTEISSACATLNGVALIKDYRTTINLRFKFAQCSGRLLVDLNSWRNLCSTKIT